MSQVKAEKNGSPSVPQ